MRWFKHDSDAHMDARMRRLVHKWGIEGYGLYWYCLELIAKDVTAKNLTFELEHDAEIIAHDMRMSREKVEDMMRSMVELGLFENSEGQITCLKLFHRIDLSQGGSKAFRDAITAKRKEVESGQSHDHDMTVSGLNHDGVMTESCLDIDVDIDIKNNVVDFEKLWGLFDDSYGSKGSKKNAKAQFLKIKPDNALFEQMCQAVERQKAYKTYLRESNQFTENFKHVERWLRDERWKDTIPEFKSKSHNRVVAI